VHHHLVVVDYDGCSPVEQDVELFVIVLAVVVGFGPPTGATADHRDADLFALEGVAETVYHPRNWLDVVVVHPLMCRHQQYHLS